jgi:hypothetical protein
MRRQCERRIGLFQSGEFVKDAQPDALTFFRMKLRGKDIVLPDRGRERGGIIGLGRRQVGVLGNHVILVNEIDGGIGGQVGQVRRRPLHP